MQSNPYVLSISALRQVLSETNTHTHTETTKSAFTRHLRPLIQEIPAMRLEMLWLPAEALGGLPIIVLHPITAILQHESDVMATVIRFTTMEDSGAQNKPMP